MRLVPQINATIDSRIEAGDIGPPTGGSVEWVDVDNTPTTLSGYGITDAAADSHTHSQSDITSLVGDLAAKAAVSHSHAIADSTGLQAALDAKLASSAYTSGDVLAKLLTVDGAGSGIDADLLDGSSSAAFATASHSHAQSDVTNLTTDLAAKQATLVSGTNIKTVNGTTLLGSGDLVVGGAADFVTAGADTAVNNASDQTIATRTVTGLVAGDQVVVEGFFTILNNSGATRVYTITLDFDGLFDIEFATGACAASATLMHPFYIRGVLDIRSTSLAYCVAALQGALAAGVASGGDVTIAATMLNNMSWATSASNATGSTDVTLRCRSANNTATQTFRLHSLVVRKITPN